MLKGTEFYAGNKTVTDSFSGNYINSSGNSRKEIYSMDDYLKERVETQRKWYETKASMNKKTFLTYQTYIIILGALIPVLVAFEIVVPELKKWGGPITAAISAVIAIIAGLDKLRQPQPNWFNYRANEETIKKEEWLYKYKAGQYRDLSAQEANRLLVERVESIISADIARVTNLNKEEVKGGRGDGSTIQPGQPKSGSEPNQGGNSGAG